MKNAKDNSVDWWQFRQESQLSAASPVRGAERNSPALWPGRAGAPRKSSGCRCPTMARTASAAIACERLPGKSRLARLL